jgi:hypothetical protein
MIENNVAIIVGSLPAFVVFMRRYVAELSAYKSLRSVLSNHSPESKEDWQQKDIETFGGSGKQRKKTSYYELSDITTLNQESTGPDEDHMATG